MYKYEIKCEIASCFFLQYVLPITDLKLHALVVVVEVRSIKQHSVQDFVCI